MTSGVTPPASDDVGEGAGRGAGDGVGELGGRWAVGPLWTAPAVRREASGPHFFRAPGTDTSQSGTYSGTLRARPLVGMRIASIGTVGTPTGSAPRLLPR